MSPVSGGSRAPLAQHHQPAIRYLVESALRKVVDDKADGAPKVREDWINTLCDALVSTSESSHHQVIASMVASGMSMDDIFDNVLPDASRQLGERWVNDTASFVEVTVGASRIQKLVRSRGDMQFAARDRLIPLGQSVLMVIPKFEDHSIGAFIAANQFRRHGLWTHMAIGLEPDEICAQISAQKFGMVGVTFGSAKTVESIEGLVDYLRSNLKSLPPLVLGGRGVQLVENVEERTGADHAVDTAREAIERCQLASLAKPLLTVREP